MKDNEIIKALERCISSTTSEACNGCPLYETTICTEMENGLMIYALDLINRQKTEIDDLKRDTIPKLQYGLDRANKYGLDTDKENRQLKAEIEELTYKLECLLCHSTGGKLSKASYSLKTMECAVTDYINDCCYETDTEIKSEAIKEFAEKLETLGARNNAGLIIFSADKIDNLVKEMTEGN